LGGRSFWHRVSIPTYIHIYLGREVLLVHADAQSGGVYLDQLGQGVHLVRVRVRARVRVRVRVRVRARVRVGVKVRARVRVRVKVRVRVSSDRGSTRRLAMETAARCCRGTWLGPGLGRGLGLGQG